MLKNRYVLMRSGARDYERDVEKKINIPITVRCIIVTFKSNVYLSSLVCLQTVKFCFCHPFQ